MMASPNPPQFPNHTHPRTWLLTSAASPLGIALARAVLAHGDSVVLGVGSSDVEKEHGKTRERAEDFGRFVREEIAAEGWRDRCRVVGLDGRCEHPLPSSLENTAIA